MDPILVESYLSSSKLGDKPLVAYAEVRQGFYPVVNATVVAIIETPAGTTVELPLLDNGAGKDFVKHSVSPCYRVKSDRDFELEIA